ncbi:MAG: ABC transporter ATP-binding protein/permease [Clostridiales Family XIII bacterium]|jgi:ATP-binding cassette subfamily B protein|nr:ABC transporter ATP-binding protein/permease [Clostridiales Family XIII bacterium]
MLKIIKRLPAGMVILAIVFVLIQVAAALYLPQVMVDIVNNGVMAGKVDFIRSRGFLMILLSVCSLAAAIFNTFIFSRLSYKLGSELRSDIFGKALSFSKAEFDKIGTASLITRNTNDVTQVQTLVEMGLKFLILSPCMLFGGIIMTGLLSPKLALVFLCAVPFLIVSYIIIYRFASPLFTKMQKLLDKMNLLFREGLTGARVIRAFCKEGSEYEKYRAVNREYTHASVTAGTIMSIFVPLITMLISLATVVITWIAGVSVSGGTMQIGAVMGAISYSGQILMGFGMLTAVILAIPRGQVSAKRINEVLDMPVSITDPAALPEAKTGLSASGPSLQSLQSLAGGGSSLAGAASLTFENVDFRYAGAERKTLEGIAFSVNPGQTLAIIGSTGEGKTTLVNLISRLYDVTGGGVKIGGTDVRAMKQSVLHDAISFSPQKSTLFFGTIRSNMLMGKPGATDDEIWAALDMAQATEFVRTLAQGLDSAVEKGGGDFSGGQKQRLCIARTLIKNAGVYVFDDSFSALDFKTDSLVRAAMKSKLQGAVTVIVAQRLSTVMDADLIAVLDGGKLAGLGTHEQLEKTNRVYGEIIASQVYKEEAV